MPLHVKEVPLAFVNATWPLVEKFISDSVAYSEGELSLEETKVRVVDGSWQLYVALNDENVCKGAATVCFFNRTDNRVAHVTNIGGRLLANQQTFQEFCELLRNNGATCIEGAARDSLVRLWTRLGARKKYTTIIIPLNV